MCREDQDTCNSGTAVPLPQQPSSNNKRTIKLRELRSHNMPQNAWAAIHGRVYNLSSFAERHPGGDTILLAAGRDATILFESYHPRGVPSSLLDSLQVGILKDDQMPTTYYSFESDFYPALKRRVMARLRERRLCRRGGWEIWIKAVFLLVGFWVSLYKMCFTLSYGGAVLWSLAMGVFAAFIGTCIQHDGNHGAFAESRLLNKIAGWTQDMIGASAFTWEFQHMLGHHPYTNVLDELEELRKEWDVDCDIKEKDQESDPDVFSSFPLMRMHPYHQLEWYHQYQHIYGPLIFALMTLAKVFHQDFDVVLTNHLYHIDASCRYGSILNLVRFWVMKALSMIYMLALPCYYQGVGRGISLFLFGHFTCGEVLATMFIVNHVIEGIAFGTKTGEKTFDRPTTVDGISPMEQIRAKGTAAHVVPLHDWAAVQCQTSMNWSPGSWFWNHMSGGLSHQIEHHLFPSICHTNYVHIQDVVEMTCKEYQVPYQSEPSLFVAYGKMLRHLKSLGSKKEV